MRGLLLWIALVAPVAANADDFWRELSQHLEAVSFRDEFLKLTDLTAKDVDPECWKHIRLYAEGMLQENATWAKMMFNSVEKSVTGLLYGRRVFIGNFDECLSARTKMFKGKHCMVDISFLPKPENYFDFWMKAYTLSYGICLPSTCRGSDIEAIANLLPVPGVNVTAPEENCWTDDPVSLTRGDLTVIYFFVGVAVVALCSTAFDIAHQNNLVKAERHELYSSFSLHSNLKYLMRISRSAGSISCLHGIRTLTMCWVVLGHEYVMPLFGPVINAAVIFGYIYDKGRILVTNALVSVDTFFLLSGLLVTLVFFRDVSQKKSYDVPVAIVHRLLRITPAYAAMVLIQSTIILKMGRGPMWYPQVAPTVKTCQENWWGSLTYLQNFICPTSTCLGQSWYLSSDMQMFWLSPVLLYPMLLWPKLAPVFYFIGLAAALTTNFAVSYAFNLGPHVFLSQNNDQFQVDYIQTHMRLTPYIIGMGMGYIICGLKANKLRVNLSPMWIAGGWLLSAGLCLGSMYGLCYFLDTPVDYTTWQASSYLTFHRLGWSLGVSWIIFACVSGYGGPVNQLLSWDGFQVLGKLSYCIFLVHFTIQICKVGVLHVGMHISDFEIVSSYFGSLFLALLLSVPLYLLFEAPFSNIDRYFLRNLTIFPYPTTKYVKEHEATDAGSKDAKVEGGVANEGFEK